jgi:hypothetical protein
MSDTEQAQHADDVRGWHGWSRGGVALHVGPVPGRKSIALYSHVGVTATVLAYFRDDESAFRALAVLDHLCRVKTCGGVERAEHIDG